MTKTLSWASGETSRPLTAAVLQFTAAGLQAASNLLTQVADRMAAARPPAAPEIETLEFHAVYRESCAPEGALYVNGQLIGTIVGVTRL